MAKFHNSVVNENVPRTGNAVTRWLGQSVLNILGWTIIGELPQAKKLVYIGCPHTSNWDGILAVSTMQALGVRSSWIMKKEAFIWPLSGLFKRLGGVPVARKAAKDIPTQMAEWFNSQDKAYLGLTPEGTRSKVTKYKTGYLRIAQAANVPLFLIAIDGPNKQIIIDRVWDLTGDIKADNAAIKAHYDAHYKGIRPELS